MTIFHTFPKLRPERFKDLDCSNDLKIRLQVSSPHRPATCKTTKQIEQPDEINGRRRNIAISMFQVRTHHEHVLPVNLMHITNLSIMLALFSAVVAIPLITLIAAFTSSETSQEAPEPREPLMPDAAYPSTWLAPGWNRKFLKAPLETDSLMELYTTSVRYLREKDLTNASRYSYRILEVLAQKQTDYPLLRANVINNLGCTEYYSNAEQAQSRFQIAMEMALENGDAVTVASSARNLSAVLLFQKKLQEAQTALDTAKQAIVEGWGEEARHLVDIEVLQKALDRAGGKGKRR